MEKRTPEAVAYAKLLVEQGLDYTEAGRRIGVSRHTIREWVDPDYIEARRIYVNKQRRGKGYGGAQGKIDPESERKKPTLVHIPGVEIANSYRTAITRMKGRREVHGAILKPREMFASTRDARLVHLGRGKVMME